MNGAPEVHEAPALEAVRADEGALAFYLEVPPAQVVLLQTLFETYEGVAVVRTLETQRSLVCVLTTPSQQEVCAQILESVRRRTGWRPVSAAPELQNRIALEDFRRKAGGRTTAV